LLLLLLYHHQLLLFIFLIVFVCLFLCSQLNCPELILGADEDCNLFSLRRKIDTADAEDRARLVPNGRFHLGSKVNVFKEGSLVRRSANHEASPTVSHIFGTVSGMLGVIVPLSQQDFQFFNRLEDILSESFIRSVGAFPHRSWRAYRTSNPVGFHFSDKVQIRFRVVLGKCRNS
jgi:hypothetical protein